jgi:hypothetical protein
MPLEKIIVPIPVGGGVDTRTDPLMLQPPRMAEATNVRLGRPGRVEKRPGMARVAEPGVGAGYASILRSRWLLARGDELALCNGRNVAQTGPGLLPEWFPQTPRFGPTMGGLSVTRRTFPSVGGVDCTLPEAVTHNGQTLLVYEQDYAGTVSCVYRLFDDEAGVQIFTSTLESGATRPRAIVCSGQFMIFYALVGSTALKVLLAGKNQLFGVPPSAVTLASDLHATSSVFDVAVSGGRVLCVYNSTTATTIKFTWVEPGGALESAFTSQATASAVTAVACGADNRSGSLTPDYIVLAWASDAGTRLDVRTFLPDKTAVAAADQVDAANTGYRQIGICFFALPSSSAAKAMVLYEVAGASRHLDSVWMSDGLTSSGSFANGAIYARHCGLASRPWVDAPGDGTHGVNFGEDDVHFVAVHDSTLQGCYFVMSGEVQSETVVKAQLLPGLAGGRLPRVGHLPAVQTLSAGLHRWVGLERERVFLDGVDLDAADGLPLPSTAVTTSGRFPVAFEFDTATKPGVAVIGDVAYVTGGILQRYDGQFGMESGFLLYPENVTVASSADSGSLVAGAVHIYLVYFQCRTPDGTQRSTAVPVTATVGVGEDTLTLTIPTLFHTRKRSWITSEGEVSIAVFRNANGGNAWYRVSNPDPATAAGANSYVPNLTGSNTTTFVDKMSDATLIGGTREPDIFASGDVLDHEAPPSCRCIAAGSNRLFLAGCDDPNLIWASKLRNFGEPVEFSDDLTISVDDDQGQPITALAVRGEVLYAFRRNRIYQVSIEPGPDNTGFNGEFSQPRLISWDTGTENPHSVVQYPAGILYQSDRGFYTLGDGGVQYVGADVDRYKDDPVVAATLIPDQHEIRLLQADRCLVFEYLTGSWAVWDFGGLDAVLWQGKHTVLPGDSGLVLQESDTEFKDNGSAYAQVMEWPWLHVGDTQGAQRVYRFLFLGTYRGPHYPVVEIAYDYEPGFVEAHPWTPTVVVTGHEYGDQTPYGQTGSLYGGGTEGALATTVYQFEVRPNRPRCQAIKTRLRDGTLAGATPMGDSFSLSAMAMEVGVRPKLVNLPTDKKAP